MVARFNPGGEVPVTPAPVITAKEGSVKISAADHASIGYRVDDGPWLLYAAPFTPGERATIEAAAVRYGWTESDTVEFRLGEQDG